MAEIVKQAKINIVAGKADPKPPLGPVLGGLKVPIKSFIDQFNTATADKEGILPTVIRVYDDGSFDFETKTPPTTSLILKELKLEKASSNPNTVKVGKLTKEQLRKIAEIKMPDLNAHTVEQAMAIVAGSAQNMGVEVVE